MSSVRLLRHAFSSSWFGGRTRQFLALTSGSQLFLVLMVGSEEFRALRWKISGLRPMRPEGLDPAATVVAHLAVGIEQGRLCLPRLQWRAS